MMKRLKLLFFLLSLVVSLSVQAQRERNYIYLLDCTKSMEGYNGTPNIWQPTKNFLQQELKKHTPGTSLHVIPFQNTLLPAYHFKAGEHNWQKIEKELDAHLANITNTNICDAWDATDKYIDKFKDNYIILMTDGQDNHIKGVDCSKLLAKKLREWCDKHPHSYAFYVQLTEAAVDEEVVKVINLCDYEFIVDARNGIPVFGSFESGLTIYANTLNLNKKHRLAFSAAGTYAAKTECKDSFFDVKIINNKIVDGMLTVQISAKKPIADINATLPQEYPFNFDVKSDEVQIHNSSIRVVMTNKPERTMETLSEETSIGKASWYDSFLFWGASEPETINIDLKTIFNEEAKKDGAVVVFKVVDADEINDFQPLYNNQPVDNNTFTINSNDASPSILSIVFNPQAKEGKRYLVLKAISGDKLDKINDQPVKEYQVVLRAKYSVGWNPLKTILMWAGIILLAALLLWLLLFKRFIYPTISVKTIQITEPYFSKVDVKGKRRVIFTNKPMQQGLLSRIFTGEILYKKNDIWTSPLGFEAGTKKKTLRVMRTKDYVFDPYESSLKAPNDYLVENVNENIKIKMTIN